MVIFTLALSLMGVCPSAFAQSDWAPIGTEWYFTLRNSRVDGHGYLAMTVVGDTTLNDTACRVIRTHTEGVETAYVDSLEFMFKQGDSLFRYLRPKGGFGLMFDFGAEPGDTLVLEALNPSPIFYGVERFRFRIDTTYSFIVNGDSSKVLEGRLVVGLSDPFFYGPIIENIGNICMFFPVFGGTLAADYPEGMRCYTHPTLGTYRPDLTNLEYCFNQSNVPNGPWPYPCDTVFSFADSSVSIQESPWPALRWQWEPSSGLRLDLPGGPSMPLAVEVIDLSGRVLCRKRWPVGQPRLDLPLGEPSRGLYLLRVHNGQGRRWTGKVAGR